MLAARENDTKKRIQAEAIILFKSNGFNTVTINDICEAAGINKHTFYYYFKSKDDLLSGLTKIPDDISSDDFANLVDLPSYAERIWMLISSVIKYPAEVGPEIFARLHMQMMSPEFNRDKSFFNNYSPRKATHRIVKTYIAKGKELGDIRSSIPDDVLLMLLLQSVHSTVFMWAHHNGGFDYMETARFLFEGLLDLPPEQRKASPSALDAFHGRHCFHGGE